MQDLYFNIAGALVASALLAWLISVRLRQDTILQKNQPGTDAYRMYSQLRKPYYIFMIGLIDLMFVIGVFASTANAGLNGSSLTTLVIGAAIVIAIGIKTYIRTRNTLKK